MNKHIFGFILFSLIVGISAIIYGFFFSPLTAIQPVYVFENQPEKRKSCRKEKYTRFESKEFSAKVTQAVFNQRTNQLDMELLLEHMDNQAQFVELYFFVKDGVKTRYLATEKVVITPEYNGKGEMIQNITESYEWLENLKPHEENLYVISETIGNYAIRDRNSTPKFDKAKATSVITLSGR